MKNVEHQKYIYKSSSENSTSTIYDLIILKLYFGIFHFGISIAMLL